MEKRKDSTAICFNHLRELHNKNLKGSSLQILLQAQALFAAEHSSAIACFLTELKTAHI